MEGDLRILIAGLAFKDDKIIASVFLDNSQLGENIAILRKLSRKYWEEESDFSELIDLLEIIRPTRNLFIHGLWSPMNFGEPDGFASVDDLRTFYEKKQSSRTWRHRQTEKFSINDFRRFTMMPTG